jgi:hypothetical protein
MGTILTKLTAFSRAPGSKFWIYPPFERTVFFQNSEFELLRNYAWLSSEPGVNGLLAVHRLEIRKTGSRTLFAKSSNFRLGEFPRFFTGIWKDSANA